MTQNHYLVVGGSHGIGRDIVQQLLSAGNHVTMISRNSEGVPADPKLSHIAQDVIANPLTAEQIPSPLAGMVFCPGSITLRSFRSLQVKDFLDDFHLNVIGAVTSIQAALPALKASGSASIVLFSTVAVCRGMSMHASIAAAKGAVEGLMRSLAAELAPQIRVNCIAPALTDTPLAERLLSTEEKRSAMSGKYPLGRVGQPADIAAAAFYLLSSQSSWVSGQVLHVDGGMSTLMK
jgi:3-oxoacyl-[acyl-carrier protein] reductase